MVRLAAAVALAATVALAPAAARADTTSPGTVLSGYAVEVQAPVFQFTEDFPQAPEHPIAEFDHPYASATLDQTRAHALASVVWPGAEGGNLGSLIGVLGGPTVAALNDPVKAEVASGEGPPVQTTSAGGTVMSASVQPTHAGDQEASAVATAAGGGMGKSGTFGTSSATSTANLDPATGKITTSALSHASNVDLAGIVTIGSFTSSVSGISTNASTPVYTATDDFHDFRIAGQQAYVDGSGVHLGAPGHPASPETQSIVDQALNAFGMKIYFSAPQHVVVGEISYYYAASVLVYWPFPDDPNHDSATVSIGGAAIGMNLSSGPAPTAAPGATGAATGGSGPAPTSGAGPALAIPAPPASPSLSLPAPAGSGPTPLPAAVAPSSPVRTAAGPELAAASRGIGVPWLVLLALGALFGLLALPRLPALLSAAAVPGCERERARHLTKESLR